MSTPKRTHSPPPAHISSAKKPRSTKPTRFLILSDTHDLALPTTLPPCDILLHCGDLTEYGTPESLSNALISLGRVQAELRLVIAGNHDIYLDKPYCVSQGGSTADITAAARLVSSAPDSVASQNRVTFLHEGTHSFTLASGASLTVYASPFTPAHGVSAFQYASCEDRFNPVSVTPRWARNVGSDVSRIPALVDVVMTHGPARYILDSAEDGASAGCEHLRRAVARVRPRLFCCGHVHGGYGAQRLEYDDDDDDGDGKNNVEEGGDCIVPLAKEWVGKNQARKKGYASLPPGSLTAFHASKQQTLAINAAMEGEKGVLENAPWVVELHL